MHQDHLTGTSLVTSNTGSLVESLKYFPFGTTRSLTGTDVTDKKFTGQRLDSTGLYYYGARYYDPTIGCFISPDTIVQKPGNPQSLNRYSYCLNNPLRLIDPTGHYWLDYWLPGWNDPRNGGSGYGGGNSGGNGPITTVIPFDVTVTAVGSFYTMPPPDKYPYAEIINNIGMLARSPLAPGIHVAGALAWQKWDERHSNRQQIAQARVYGDVTITDVPGYPLEIKTTITVEGEGIGPSNPIFHGYKNTILDEYATKIPFTGGQNSIYVDHNITPFYVQIDFSALPQTGFYDVKLNYDSLVVNLQTDSIFKIADRK